MVLQSKNKGFSLVELIVVIAILVVFAAVLIPSLLQYTENSRAQKDVSAMDEVVNAVQLAMADQNCYDEMLQYSCTNNYITYTDSSGVYGQVIADGEYWAPDGSGRATTITFNPEVGPNGDTIYNLDTALVNDMTYGNGSNGENRVMEGSLIENNQCYLKNASLNGEQTGYLYNMVRQSIGNNVITTSQTYRNSSFTIFIKFSQKDGTTVADVDGSFNGTNLYEGAAASKGSGTSKYDENGDAITTVTTPGTTESNYTSSDLSGTATFYPEYANGGIIPEGGKYIAADGTIINAGEEINIKAKDGDIYEDEYYQYKYNARWGGTSWSNRKDQNGWGVRVLDKTLKSYGEIKESINGKPINTLYYTFWQCKSLTTAPTIPNSVTNMGNIFAGCTALTQAPVIPNGVTSMFHTFNGCSSLKTYVGSKDSDGDFSNYVIPDSVTELTCTFRQCSLLTQAPTIPNGVQYLSSAFQFCTALKQAPIIPNSVTNMGSTFEGCKFTQAPAIPNSVTYMYRTFAECTNLTTAPVLPSSLTSLEEAFEGCKKLKTYTGSKDENGDFSRYVIPNGVRNMSSAFEYCSAMTKAPSIPNGVTKMYGTFRNCSLLSQAPTIPNSVTDMSYTFYGCTSLKIAPTIPNSVKLLTGTFQACSTLRNYAGSTDSDGDFSGYVIPSKVTSLTDTFNGCYQLKTAPVIPSNVKYMNSTFTNCTQLSGTITINTSPQQYSRCFSKVDMSKITLAGSCSSTLKQQLANTGLNGSSVTIVN